MGFRGLGVAGIFAAALVLTVNLTAPPPAEASIHEIIAALCRAGGEEVVPFGQNKGGQSFVRALQASGFITTGDLDVVADATRTGEADVNFFGIALFTGEVGFEAEQTAGDTHAIIGADADITLTGGGDVTVSAVSNDSVDPHIVDVAVGAFMIGAQATSGLIESNTRSRISGRVNARNVSVSAQANKSAEAITDIVNISILSLNGVALSGIAGALPADLPIPILPPFDTVATATIAGHTEAYLGDGAEVTASGALSLTANSDNDATSNNLGVGMTLVNVSDTASHATVGGSTQVHIDPL